MNKKPINYLELNFEHERGLSPERQKEGQTEKEPGGEQTEEQIASLRQRHALVELQEKQILNAVYGVETEDEMSKDHFDIHYFGEYDEHKKTTFKIRQEYDLQIICGYLKTNFPQQKIGMYVYPTSQANPQHSLSNFRADEFRMYRVWGTEMERISFPHEITKAVIHSWDISPLDFLEEGLALAVDELAFGYKLQIGEEKKWPDEFVKDQLTTSLPSLSSVLLNSSNNYISGSFVKFLIQKYGMEKFKPYYLSISKDTNLDEINSKIIETFGETLESLENMWQQSL